MKTSRLLVDIETGGLMTDLPLEVMHQYENEPPKFTETAKEQAIKRTNRKVAIVGVPMGFHYSPTLADINPEQYKIYVHARSGRSNLAEILMFKMMLRGKSVVIIEPNGEVTELERGY